MMSHARFSLMEQILICVAIRKNHIITTGALSPYAHKVSDNIALS